jgi:hypothetical protein
LQCSAVWVDYCSSLDPCLSYIPIHLFCYFEKPGRYSVACKDKILLIPGHLMSWAATRQKQSRVCTKIVDITRNNPEKKWQHSCLSKGKTRSFSSSIVNAHCSKLMKSLLYLASERKDYWRLGATDQIFIDCLLWEPHTVLGSGDEWN